MEFEMVRFSRVCRGARTLASEANNKMFKTFYCFIRNFGLYAAASERDFYFQYT